MAGYLCNINLIYINEFVDILQENVFSSHFICTFCLNYTIYFVNYQDMRKSCAYSEIQQGWSLIKSGLKEEEKWINNNKILI